jgi:hypothetical protein
VNEPTDETPDEQSTEDSLEDSLEEPFREPFGEPFERPVDRFRKGAVGSVMAAGLLGIADALEARPPKEEIVIVREVPSAPPRDPRRLELLLDPEHPERSLVFLPEPSPDRERPEDPPQ